MKYYLVNEGVLKEIPTHVFTSGDAYLAVDEAAKKIVVWLGSKCSVDEKAAAAKLAVDMDQDQFNGAAKIISVDEGEETAEALALLGGLRVVDQNVAKSILTDVTTGSWGGHAEHVDVLYRISSEEYDGLEAMKFIQVPLKRESLDGEDCFVADLGDEIWIWQGSTCNVKEKVKSVQVAREFDADRAGGQKTRVFEQEDDAEFLEMLDNGGLALKTIGPDLDGDGDGVAAKTAQPVAIAASPVSDSAPAPAPKPKPVEVAPTPKPVEAAPAAEPVAAPGASGLLVQTGGGRAQCPRCGNDQRPMIREMQDRNHIICDYPVIYAKKYVCGKCGAEWRREE
jgi:hypothetical protein